MILSSGNAPNTDMSSIWNLDLSKKGVNARRKEKKALKVNPGAVLFYLTVGTCLFSSFKFRHCSLSAELSTTVSGYDRMILRAEYGGNWLLPPNYRNADP